MNLIKKLCLFAGVAGLCGCYTPDEYIVVRPAPAPVVIAPAPIVVRPYPYHHHHHHGRYHY